MHSDPRQNKILAALPDAVYARWALCLERVQLAHGQVICKSGARITHVYFPATSTISLIYVTSNKSTAELALVGHEGMTGTSLFMGSEFAFDCAEVQIPGEAWRLSAEAFLREFRLGGGVMHLFLRYTQALLTHISQASACSRHHSISQQVCRRLLESLDRQRGLDLLITQEAMARLLGTDRQAVARATLELNALGLVACKRGRITVLNRIGIEKRACECYAVVKKEYDRLLPPTAKHPNP